MSLNIKNNEAYTLASELAKLTGKSMTAIVIDALRFQLEQIKRQQQREKRVKELMAIGQRCAAHLKTSSISTAHGDMLYNELGLPE